MFSTSNKIKLGSSRAELFKISWVKGDGVKVGQIANRGQTTVSGGEIR